MILLSYIQNVRHPWMNNKQLGEVPCTGYYLTKLVYSGLRILGTYSCMNLAHTVNTPRKNFRNACDGMVSVKYGLEWDA